MEINKIFIELRYKDSFMFNDMECLEEIKDNVSSLLPEFKYDASNKVLILTNSKKHCNVNITGDRMVIDYDEPKSFEEFQSLAKEVLEITTNHLKIRNFTRIGIRSFRGENKQNGAEALSNVRKNFLKIHDSDLNILADKLISVGVTFSFIKDKYVINLNITPNNFKVVEIENGVVTRDIDKSQVLIDSDIYREGEISREELINEFLVDFIDINNNSINSFMKKVGKY